MGCLMLRGLSGWLLLLGVIYIPWHDGGVAPLATALLSGLVFFAAMLWLLGHATGGTKPRIPLACLACVGLLLVQGWWMAINTLRRYDPVTHTFFPGEPILSAAPGTWDGPSSQAAALAFSSMLLSVCIACDLCHYPKWRKRFAYGLALNGALIALVGILKAAGADPLIPVLGVRQGTSFASFEYHGNAGAFLNLCLPPAFALFVHMRHRTHHLSWRCLAAVPFLLIAAGAMVNVSRAAQAITVLLTMGLIGWAFSMDRAHPEKTQRRRWTWQWSLPVIAIGLMVVGALATTRNRWAYLPGQLHSKNDRLIMWQVCGYWLSDAGLMGYGPGTYKLIYPTTPQSVMHDLYSRWIVRPYVPGEPVSVWHYVYNDYLQLAFEWGWLGVAVWMVLLMGGMISAVRAMLRPSPVFADQIYGAAATFALVGLCLHSVIDYPLQVICLQFYGGLMLGLGWSSLYWRSETVPHSLFGRLNLDVEAARCN